MNKTNIEWTDRTWNPTVGCTRVSEGCRNCYAFQLHDKRHKAKLAGKRLPDQYAKPFNELQLMTDRLAEPLSWRKPQKVFVNSVSDLFHKDVPDEFLDRVFAVMALSPRHTFQVLTKRPERMAAYVAGCLVDGKLRPALRDAAIDVQGGSIECDVGGPNGFSRALATLKGWPWPLPNLWLGTSVENQAAADERIPHLLATPAAVRFLSCEPLLGPVTIRCANSKSDELGLPFRPLKHDIHWVIVGGESGPDSRHCRVEWVRSLVDQCRAAGVACFVKQDSGPRSGQQGRIPLDIWQMKEFPDAQ